jgi:hypothetical protein
MFGMDNTSYYVNMQSLAQSDRNAAHGLRDSAQIFSRKAATCNDLIERVTKILNDGTESRKAVSQ